MNLFSCHGCAAVQLPAAGGSGEDSQALSALAKAGFLRRSPDGQIWTWASAAPDADRLLLGLLSKFDLHLQIGWTEDAAAWLALAVWEPDTTDGSAKAGAVFGGTGFAPSDAVRSCLGEFAEFQSWLYRPGDGDRRCHRDQLDSAAIDPWRVLGFADEQRRHWRELNERWRGYEAVPEPWAFDSEVHWSRARKLTDGSVCWVPAQLCHGRYSDSAEHRSSSWRNDSNGCAAGQTEDHALASALLELIERDATGIWWYGQCPRPAVPQSWPDNGPLQVALDHRRRRGQRVHLLDLTHDLRIPVVAAVLLNPDATLAALGFGCGFSHACAASSAYLEMCQMELSVALVRQRAAETNGPIAPDDQRLLAWLSRVNAADHPHLTPAGTASVLSAVDGTGCETILQRLAEAGLDAYAVDLRRTDIGVPAERAFVPGLCHFKPRLGFRRLVDVPRQLGWRDQSFGFENLSALPLLI